MANLVFDNPVPESLDEEWLLLVINCGKPLSMLRSATQLVVVFVLLGILSMIR